MRRLGIILAVAVLLAVGFGGIERARADLPISLSCTYFASNPYALTVTQVIPQLQCDSNGRLMANTRIQDGVGSAVAGVIGTSNNVNPTGLAVHGMNYCYNGSGFDPCRSRLGEIQITDGGTTRTKATSTVCVSVAAGTQNLHRIWASGTETATMSIYDEGSSPTCAAADLVYGKIPPNGTPDVLDVPMVNGIAYKLSAAAAMNDYITSN